MNLKNIVDRKLAKLLSDESRYEFSEFLISYRNALGITMARVCEDTNISTTQLSLLEKGLFKKMPSEKLMERLCLYYTIDYDFLMEKCAESLKKSHLRKIKQKPKPEVLSIHESS